MSNQATTNRPPTPSTVTLQIEDGILCLPLSGITDALMRDFFKDEETVLLICQYPAGDHDLAHWPFCEDGERILRSALYDAREQGLMPDAKTVVLPDGTEFVIDK